ncbi:MAG: peroxiredoxin family protein [Phototrophicaceae bacterium]
MSLQLDMGDTPPSLSLYDYKGKLHNLSDYHGQPVLLTFYRFAACPLCSVRLHQLIVMYSQLQSKGLQVVGIFRSTTEEIKRHLGKRNLPFILLADPHAHYYREYGVPINDFDLLFPPDKASEQSPLLSGINRRQAEVRQLPADFLIRPDGIVHTAYYGMRRDDHISVERIQEFLALNPH